MAFKTSFKIEGLQELKAAFKNLTQEVQEHVVRRAVGKSAVLMKEEIIKKALLPNPGPLASKPYRHGNKVYPPGSVAAAVIAVRKTEVVGKELYVVGVRSNKANGYMGRIASFNEFGTVKMTKQPFMTPGFEETKKPAQDLMVEVLRNGIEAAARKANKGKKK